MPNRVGEKCVSRADNLLRRWRCNQLPVFHFGVAVGVGVWIGVGRGVEGVGMVRCPSANGITHKASSRSRKSALRIRYVLMVGSTRFTRPHFSTLVIRQEDFSDFADDCETSRTRLHPQLHSTKARRMAAHQKLNRRRVYLYALELVDILTRPDAAMESVSLCGRMKS